MLVMLVMGEPAQVLEQHEMSFRGHSIITECQLTCLQPAGGAASMLQWNQCVFSGAEWMLYPASAMQDIMVMDLHVPHVTAATNIVPHYLSVSMEAPWTVLRVHVIMATLEME